MNKHQGYLVYNTNRMIGVKYVINFIYSLAHENLLCNPSTLTFELHFFWRFFLHFSHKTTDVRKKDVPYKKPNLNHTEYAYREAVNRLKSMLNDSYSACKSNGRRHGYESDDTDNVSVS